MWTGDCYAPRVTGLIGLLSGLHLSEIINEVTSIRYMVNFRPACYMDVMLKICVTEDMFEVQLSQGREVSAP